MKNFYYCAFINADQVAMIGTDTKHPPLIPAQKPKPDLIIAGTAQGEETRSKVLFPNASWDGSNIAIEGVKILTQETV